MNRDRCLSELLNGNQGPAPGGTAYVASLRHVKSVVSNMINPYDTTSLGLGFRGDGRANRATPRGTKV